jgi:hypothetical protein
VGSSHLALSRITGRSCAFGTLVPRRDGQARHTIDIRPVISSSFHVTGSFAPVIRRSALVFLWGLNGHGNTRACRQHAEMPPFTFVGTHGPGPGGLRARCQPECLPVPWPGLPRAGARATRPLRLRARGPGPRGVLRARGRPRCLRLGGALESSLPLTRRGPRRPGPGAGAPAAPRAPWQGSQLERHLRAPPPEAPRPLPGSLAATGRRPGLLSPLALPTSLSET